MKLVSTTLAMPILALGMVLTGCSATSSELGWKKALKKR